MAGQLRNPTNSLSPLTAAQLIQQLSQYPPQQLVRFYDHDRPFLVFGTSPGGQADPLPGRSFIDLEGEPQWELYEAEDNSTLP